MTNKYAKVKAALLIAHDFLVIAIELLYIQICQARENKKLEKIFFDGHKNHMDNIYKQLDVVKKNENR